MRVSALVLGILYLTGVGVLPLPWLLEARVLAPLFLVLIVHTASCDVEIPLGKRGKTWR